MARRTPTFDPETVAVGGRIRELRGRARLTLEGLSERTGITAERLSRIERGEQSPTVRTIMRVAHGLGVEPGTLFRQSGEPRDERDSVPVRLQRVVDALNDRTDEDLSKAEALLHIAFASPVDLRILVELIRTSPRESRE